MASQRFIEQSFLDTLPGISQTETAQHRLSILGMSTLLRHAEEIVRSPSAFDNLNQYHDCSDHQQDMNEASNGGGRDHPKQPQNDKHNCDGP
jgi:hypothetical protein